MAAAVGEAEAPDVDRIGAVVGYDAAQAEVEAEPAQGAQARGQPMDLQVAVHRLLADATGCLALGSEPIGQVRDRLLEALRDGSEVLLVAVDQRRFGLGGEALGQVEGARGRTAQDLTPHSWTVASVRDCAGRPGPCGKPPERL